VGSDLHETARRLRNLVEPIAAGVYFAPEAQQRYEQLGLNYFEGYFCSRGACLGKAPWSVICAAFGAFKPEVVERAVTGGWSKTDPEALLAARLAGATDQLTRLLGEPGPEVKEASEILFSLTDGVDRSGRMLFSGLSVLPLPDTPIARLWRAADLVREHRGDGHIAAWISRTDSCEITVLTELTWGLQPGAYVFTRGWNEEEVDAARDRLRARGLLDGDNHLTEAGQRFRAEIEHDTDLAEREVIDRLGDRADELFALLQPMAKAIVEGGGYPVDFTKLRGTRG
jgi:helix-turn-helix protein